LNLNNHYRIFNPTIIANFNVQQYEQQRKFLEQQENITKMVQAIKDYCEASRNIAPEYAIQAQQACIAEILRQSTIASNARNF
jgi:hypothetical protein